ncbi:MAG: DNA polymerase II large subunit [Candidatus Methanofastidiosia archaeon]
MSYEDYFDSLESNLLKLYEIARDARVKGNDPDLKVEIFRASDMAERVEMLVGPRGVAQRIHELEKEEISRESLSLKIIDDIVENRFGRIDGIRLVDQCLRAGLAILTEGLVAAPLEGIAKIEIKQNLDATNYLAIYFAGPIRSAGGTAAALAVLLGDYTRQKLHLDRYRITPEEIERFVEEVDLYNKITRLQYRPMPSEIRFTLSNLPVEITGESTEKEEVSGYRDLRRIETNRVRGGAVLALSEGVIQKNKKMFKLVGEFGIEGWEFLEKLHRREREERISENWKYLKDVIAGRPILSYPMAQGGFRIRLGKSRNTGFGAWGIHPCTMLCLDDFLAVGTQLKIERPGKATVVAPVDSIEGPIVKLRNGAVLRCEDYDETLKIREEIDEILFLGDALISFGDFLQNNHRLLPSSYVEEWWLKDLEKVSRLKIDPFKVSERKAIALSRKYKVPLHPKYTHFWNYLEKSELLRLLDWDFESFSEDVKAILEKICVPHHLEDDGIVVNSLSFFECLDKKRYSEGLSIFENLSQMAGFPIRNKCTYTVGARMGRPEKAKYRAMSPPVHTLFPVGKWGGRTRSIPKASEGEIGVELVNLSCPKCGEKAFKRKCSKCGSITKLYKTCSSERCDFKSSEITSDRCPRCNSLLNIYSKKSMDLKREFEIASEVYRDFKTLKDVKGVIGMTSGYKFPEALSKGILRAKHTLFVFKDGTIRFDATDLPLTHFKPEEIGVPVEKLRELGYEEDYLGNPLKRENQIVELRVQDILISENGADYLFRVSKFIDELLERFYGLESFYNLSSAEELVGHLVIGLAPHTSAGILGRIIGFTKARVGYAHPFFHAAKRRNCDGDEDSVILALDALLNFSRYYLPEKRGGKMDAPLVLSTKINPWELDKEAHDLDIADSYPIEIYESSFLSPQNANIETAGDRLSTENLFDNFRFTHQTQDIAKAPVISAYKTLRTMLEKINAQFEVARKVRAVNMDDAAERLINAHFLPDLIGNLHSFSKQKFRCTNCNRKFRRIPLRGRCWCGGNLVLTVSKGSVEKYLKIAKSLIEKYQVSNYVKQRLSLTEEEINEVFREQVKQLRLVDFV